MPDTAFSLARLAAIYDLVDSDRSDLEVYADLVAELGAHTVLDVGCGTGSLACLLAQRGKDVIGLDPAAASLAVARAKPNGQRVRWILGDAAGAPRLDADLVTMTGNVAQVFLSDEDWTATLEAARRALRARGHLVFEVRDPGYKGWLEWTRELTYRRLDIPGTGTVETWVDLTEVDLPFVSFRATFAFAADGAVLTSDSTLRFRSRDEVEESLVAARFSVEEVRDAPDRPGRELVFIARKSADDREAET